MEAGFIEPYGGTVGLFNFFRRRIQLASRARRYRFGGGDGLTLESAVTVAPRDLDELRRTIKSQFVDEFTPELLRSNALDAMIASCAKRCGRKRTMLTNTGRGSAALVSTFVTADRAKSFYFPMAKRSRFF